MQTRKRPSIAQERLLILSAAVLCAIASFLFLTVLWALNVDMKSAEVLDSVYCDHVEQGIWPDYKGSYDEQCGVRGNNTNPASS